jgi:diacylglycerol kinase family enzyme
VAYAIGMLRDRLEHCTPHRLNLKLDGETLSDDFVLFEAMNMEFVGPNLYLAPDIRSDDGLLDVVLVSTHDRDELRKSLADWHRGDLNRPNLSRRRASSIELDWTGFEVHIDDEAWPPQDQRDYPKHAPIEIDVKRQALRFLAPAPTGKAP